MKEYYYIPLQYEILVANAVNEWISSPNYGWTIINGIYDNSRETIEGNSLVVNVLRENRQVQNIAKSNTLGKLIAFCLEGDLDEYAPVFKEQLLSLSGVESFITSEEFISYAQ